MHNIARVTKNKVKMIHPLLFSSFFLRYSFYFYFTSAAVVAWSILSYCWLHKWQSRVRLFHRGSDIN